MTLPLLSALKQNYFKSEFFFPDTVNVQPQTANSMYLLLCCELSYLIELIRFFRGWPCRFESLL